MKKSTVRRLYVWDSSYKIVVKEVAGMDAKRIGECISKMRKERNMSQMQLADRLYVTEKAVSKWECGNGIPDLDNIGKLAEVFDISIEELLTGGEKEKREDISREQTLQPICDAQIMQLQESGASLIHSYEDLVVYSSQLSDPLINRLAGELTDTITQFEEILYLLDRFTPETLQKLCLYHKDKIRSDTDLSLLLGRISDESFSVLCECRDS